MTPEGRNKRIASAVFWGNAELCAGSRRSFQDRTSLNFQSGDLLIGFPYLFLHIVCCLTFRGLADAENRFQNGAVPAVAKSGRQLRDYSNGADGANAVCGRDGG